MAVSAMTPRAGRVVPGFTDYLGTPSMTLEVGSDVFKPKAYASKYALSLSLSHTHTDCLRILLAVSPLCVSVSVSQLKVVYLGLWMSGYLHCAVVVRYIARGCGERHPRVANHRPPNLEPSHRAPGSQPPTPPPVPCPAPTVATYLPVFSAYVFNANSLSSFFLKQLAAGLQLQPPVKEKEKDKGKHPPPPCCRLTLFSAIELRFLLGCPPWYKVKALQNKNNCVDCTGAILVALGCSPVYAQDTVHYNSASPPCRDLATGIAATLLFSVGT